MQSGPLDFDAISFSNLIDSKYKEGSYVWLLADFDRKYINSNNEYLVRFLNMYKRKLQQV